MNRFFLTALFITAILISVNGQTVRELKLQYREHTLPFGLKEKIPLNKPIISFALSGGGSRGFAQIGVLKALEEAGIKPHNIVGTSMGSVVGGLYASGYSANDLNSIFIHTNWSDLISSTKESSRRELFIDQKVTADKAVLTLRLKGLTPVLPTSINTGQRLANFLNLLTLKAPIHSDSLFSSLKYNFSAVCTDLVSGEAVILNSGSLSQAIRASSSVTFFLSPVRIDSLILVDGGLVSNIPAEIASKKSDFTIAVNTTSGLHNENELAYPWIIADQIVSIPMRQINEAQLKYSDFVFTPDLKKEANDFTNPDSIIQVGYNTASPLINELKQKIDSAGYKKIKEKEFFIKNITSVTDDPALSQIIQKYSLKDSVSSYEIYNDLANIYQLGFYDDVSCSITEHNSFTELKFNLLPNPTLNKIEIKGVTLIDSVIVDSVLCCLSGKPFNAHLLSENLIKVLKLFRDTGYPLVEIDSLAFSNGTLHVNFNEGIISDIEIDGNNFTNETIIRREFPINIGGPFYINSVESGLANLRSTNLFDDVVLSVKKEDNKNIVVIKVIEKVSSLARIGFRIDNENKAQVSLDLRDENLFGSGTEAGLLLGIGGKSRYITFEHKANRIVNTYLTYKLSGFYKSDDIFTYKNLPGTSDKYFSREVSGEYRETYYGISISSGFQVEKFGNIILTARYQHEHTSSLLNNIIGNTRTIVGSIKASTTLDTQDKYPYPEKGVFFYASYEMASTWLGSDAGFLNLGFDYRNYITIKGRHTISPRILMGFADKSLPFTEQYSLGGQNSFFGMRDNEYRGRQIFLASIEYRYKLPVLIFFDTYIKFRYDLGSIWEFQEQIRFKDFKHGIGTTVSFDTPIGPADFSVGRSFLFKKNLPGNPISLGDVFFYFSIGYYF